MASSENLYSLAEAANMPLSQPTPEEERRLLNCDDDIVMVYTQNSGQERRTNSERSTTKQARQTHQKDEKEAPKPMMSQELINDVARINLS